MNLASSPMWQCSSQCRALFNVAPQAIQTPETTLKKESQDCSSLQITLFFRKRKKKYIRFNFTLSISLVLRLFVFEEFR